MVLRAWYSSLDHGDPWIKGGYLQALKGADLHLEARNEEQPQSYGIVFFKAAGQAVCRFLKEATRGGKTRVLAVSVSSAPLVRDAWNIMDAGAADVLTWRGDEVSARQIAARIGRWMLIDEMLDSPWVRDQMIGSGAAWRSKLRELVEAAHFTTEPVLIMGESGTGKELAARLIHELDPRPDKGKLVVLDCTTIVPELSGSEFFGHERGAFTGAVSQREGAFALANSGTLFLDEIGELPLPLQAQLLRAIQEHTFKRVGGNAWQHAEFRIVCATNRDLQEQVRRGAFRADLYFRIASLVCTLPPLRERTEDVLSLVRHFMKEIRPGEEPPELDDIAREFLLKRQYPGNVRELKQLVSRLMHRYVGGGIVSAGNIPPEERPAREDSADDWQGAALEQAIRRAVTLGIGLKEISRVAEDIAVRIAVDAEEGNLQRAARTLGVTDRALQMRRANRRQSEELGNLSAT